jgi:hypothetical protein
MDKIYKRLEKKFGLGFVNELKKIHEKENITVPKKTISGTIKRIFSELSFPIIIGLMSYDYYIMKSTLGTISIIYYWIIIILGFILSILYNTMIHNCYTASKEFFSNEPVDKSLIEAIKKKEESLYKAIVSAMLGYSTLTIFFGSKIRKIIQYFFYCVIFLLFFLTQREIQGSILILFFILSMFIYKYSKDMVIDFIQNRRYRWIKENNELLSRNYIN